MRHRHLTTENQPVPFLQKDALNRQETYGYDLNGNLNVFTDRKNQPSTFTYDALNRRISATFADGSTVSRPRVRQRGATRIQRCFSRMIREV